MAYSSWPVNRVTTETIDDDGREPTIPGDLYARVTQMATTK